MSTEKEYLETRLNIAWARKAFFSEGYDGDIEIRARDPFFNITITPLSGVISVSSKLIHLTLRRSKLTKP